jgi:N utilization substance protein B
MAAVDRNILRCAVFELFHLEDVPPRVTINEAVELAKRYGDQQSGAFVNGLLDRLMWEEGLGEKKGMQPSGANLKPEAGD